VTLINDGNKNLKNCRHKYAYKCTFKCCYAKVEINIDVAVGEVNSAQVLVIRKWKMNCDLCQVNIKFIILV